MENHKEIMEIRRLQPPKWGAPHGWLLERPQASQRDVHARQCAGTLAGLLQRLRALPGRVDL